MPIEKLELISFSFWDWLPGAAREWLYAGIFLGPAVLALTWLILAVVRGPWSASGSVGSALYDALLDLTLLSPRRVGALTWLTAKESFRHPLVVVFALFILGGLFGAWYLDPDSPEPARLYLDRVLSGETFLLLLLVLLLSTLSLPAEIKSRTLHTVVTKPVRRSEIVLGRMLGFTIVGTGLLLVMGPLGYVFVVRGLSHTHELDPGEVELLEEALNAPVEGIAPRAALKLRTGRADEHRNWMSNLVSSRDRHRHWIYVDPVSETSPDGKTAMVFPSQGVVRTSMEAGHWHEFHYDLRSESAGQPEQSGVQSTIGPPKGLLVARVPIYGKLHFKDPAGVDKPKGINVGDEWTYRSYIQGGTLAAAVWTFQGISEHDFPRGLPLELMLGIFRTHKGEITKGVPASLAVRNPRTGQKALVRNFESKEFVTDVQFIPRQLQTPEGKGLDLFDDLVSGGEVEIWIQCVAPAQYLGAAQPDLYLRSAGDASFELNLLKGYIGIWLQMVLVISFGVMFSTLLSGPIALLATGGALLGGVCSEFLGKLARHLLIGGGPFESGIRLLTQQNVTSEMEPGLLTSVARMGDAVLEKALGVIWMLLPDFGGYNLSDYVAYGFNIPPQILLKCVAAAAGFTLPLFVIGYFFLKTRELSE